MNSSTRAGIRIDRLLVYLRFARTRSLAQMMLKTRMFRLNSKRVARPSEQVCVGDVLVLIVSNSVRIVEITGIPQSRGSAEIAQSHYRELDQSSQSALGAMRK